MAKQDDQKSVMEVASRLRAMIFDQRLPPGSRIDQPALAWQFNVPLAHIREALSRLETTRLVRLDSPNNAFVEKMSSSELEDIYCMRELLEEHAARIAAPRLTDEDIRTLEQMEKDLIAMAAAGDGEGSLALHRDLHFIIYNATGSHHLLTTLDRLWNLSGRFRQLQIHTSLERIREALYEIHLIVSACRRRDADGLGWIMRFKLRQTRLGLQGRIGMGAGSPNDETPKSPVHPE